MIDHAKREEEEMQRIGTREKKPKPNEEPRQQQLSASSNLKLLPEWQRTCTHGRNLFGKRFVTTDVTKERRRRTFSFFYKDESSLFRWREKNGSDGKTPDVKQTGTTKQMDTIECVKFDRQQMKHLKGEGARSVGYNKKKRTKLHLAQVCPPNFRLLVSFLLADRNFPF